MQDKAVLEGYYLSPQQMRIWLSQQADGSQVYKAQSAVMIEGDIDAETLKAAIFEVVNRHEILRTNFHLLPGMTLPLQVIGSGQSAEFREINLSEYNSGEKNARFEELFREAIFRGFDLRHEPVARFCLFRLSITEKVLVTSLPAICADSRSLKNLFRGIAHTCASFLHGKELPGQAIQYVDFAEWQKEMLEQEDDEGDELYERRSSHGPSFSSAPPSMLGLERGLNESFVFDPDCVSLVLDAETTAKIDHISSARHLSSGVFLLACWQVLVWRLTANKYLAIDNLCDGRRIGGLQEAVGAFARFCPVRSHLEPDDRFTEMLEIVDQSIRSANERLNLILRQESRTVEDESRAERANAIGFEFEQWPGPEFAGSVKFSYWKQYCCIDRFKLKLGGYRKAEGLTIEIQYDPSIFSRGSIELLQERYLRLIKSAVSGEQALIGDLEVIGPRERERLLVEWNETEKRLPDGRALHELIGGQAHLKPESIAVACKEEQLSYRELESRANQLANHLKLLGVGPECVVGLHLERSTEMMIGLLGILKAGGAYLPLEVGQPAERLGGMLKDADARVVVTKQSAGEGLPAGGNGVVMLDRDWERIGGCSQEGPEVELSPENLAYVIYTSGSAGKPKGVMVKHGSVANLLEGLKEAIYEGKGESLTIGVNAPIAFDGSVKQLIQLGRGRRLCIVSEEERMDAESMLEYIGRNGVEVLDCTPSQLGVLLEAGLGKGERALRVVLVGGEAIDARSWGKMSECGGVRYYNVYGPTECTVDATACLVSEGGVPTIGRPISNTRIYIMDEGGRLAPTGVVGEVYIGGMGLGRGYRGEPGLTAERYVPDAYGEREGERLYRTGDFGRYLGDGRIVYEGRKDEQVKLRGYRIELGEIEAVLRSHPGVREAVVVVREDDPGQKRLVGYVVGREQRTIEGKQRRRLPNGMSIVEQNRNETDYLYEEIFKKKSYVKHGIKLRDGGCVFDVGANIGLFTLFVSLSRKGVRVYGFEPIKPIYETLRINTKLYGGAGVKLYQVGLGEEEKREWYTYYRGYSMMSGESRYATSAEDIDVIKRYLRNGQGLGAPAELLKQADEILTHRFEEERFECRVRRLSDVMREERIERIDLLKVDVQRAEMDVLRGLKEEDWEKIDQIVMEVHDQEGGESEGRLGEIQELLEEKGYEVTIEQEELLKGTDRYNLYARRNVEVEELEELGWGEVIVDESWEEVTEESLRKYVSERLPRYMTPSALVVVGELPLTRNGKVDRRALPRPEELKKEAAVEESEHWNAYEEIISGIWKEVLKVERLRLKDNFFDVGGNSLLATQVISRVRSTFGLEIGVMSIFEEMTLERLSRRIEGAVRAGEKEQAPPLTRASGEDRKGRRPPLSFAQQRLWFLDQLVPNNPFYNCPGTLRLKGKLNLEALERVINEIVRRHEILRTRIEAPEGEPVQVIDDWKPRKLEIEDLRSLAREEREEKLRRIAGEEAGTGFDLSRGPLLRVKVLKLDEEEHVLLFTMHHIVSDGWSMGILIREIGALYQAYSRGESSPLEELPIQYADFAVWQRQWLQGEVLEAQLEYWRKQLAGMADSELPTDHPRPAVQSYRGARQRFVIERELTRKLRALGQREGVTLFMVLLGGFDVLMSRYSGQADVVVGTDIANRNRAEIEGLIGFFVNQLVLRVEIRAEASFVELLKRVRGVCLGAYAHQDVPFEKLVEELEPERDLSRSPLFQAKLIMQNAAREGLELEGLRLSSGGGVEVETTRLDLTVSIIDRGTDQGPEPECDLVGAVEYSRDLYEGETIKRLMSHYLNVLRGITEGSRKPISELNLLSDREQEQIVVEWNETTMSYPHDRCIHELFQEQAERSPEGIALIDEGQQLSYRELHRRANQLAHYLQRLGVGPEVVVGLCLERSVEMVVALLGVLKAGGAYLPLDGKSPVERVAFLLEDAGVGVVLTERGLEERLPSFWGQTICLDEEWERIHQENENEPENDVVVTNLVYVIYTSGSTGQPKGVMVEHRGLANYLCWARKTYLLEHGAVVSSSLLFDATITSLLTPLICGSTVRLLAERREVDGLEEQVRAAPVCGLVKITPSHLEVLGQRLIAEKAGSSVSILVIGGEALSPSTVDLWRQIQPGVRLVNEYGPTETVVGSVVNEIAQDARLTNTVPIGHPIANTRIYLLDRHLQPVPVGVTGEIYIGGVQVARGYLNRPELTAERYVGCLFGGEAGERMYRTGDLGRYLADGTIEYLGRNDFQVKVRGFRIEPGEVESRLAEHPAVREAVVVAREENPGEKRLVAYYTTVPGATIDAEGLRAHLSAALPESMVPAAYVRMEGLPLTANGKLDRRALPAPDGRAYAARGYEAPKGEIEIALARIWAEMLKLERVGRHDSFFDLGGHSLLAVKVVSRMRQEGLQADIAALIAAPTLAAFATTVGSGSAVVEVPPNRIPPACDAITPEMLPLVQLSAAEIERIVSTVPGGAANVQDIYPLAPLQEGILFHHLMVTEGDPYLVHGLYSFDSRARLDGFLQALQAVIERHDILRTAVLWEGLEEPVQVVWRRAPLRVEEVSLDPGMGEAAEALLARFNPRRYRIDIRQAPLIRLCIAHDPVNDRWVALSLFHHLVDDATSLGLLVGEIQAHLLGRIEQLPTPLPFRDFVAQARLGVSREEHEAFFKKMLGDVDEPTAPYGLISVQGDGSEIREAWREVDVGLASRLRQRARDLGVSAASVFHLVWAQVLARVTGRGDVVFGTVLFGRMQGSEGADRILGLFANTLPVRIRIGNDSVQESVRQIHSLLAQLLHYEHAPLALAQRCSAVVAPAPLFTSFLNYRHNVALIQPSTEAQQAWEGIQRLGSEERSNYPLSLNVDDPGEGFVLNAQVQSPVDPVRVCAYLHAALERLVEALERAPATPVRSLDVLPASERHQLLVEWNQTARPYQNDRCIHELFEEQVGSTPEAAALIYEDRQLSYRELNASANQLAHYLRRLGVGPERLVGICVERSLEMVIGLLATLKAGGAYVPLDPADPIERLTFMLEDSLPVVVLTQLQVQTKIRSMLTEAGMPVIDLESDAGRWAGEPKTDADRASVGLTPEHLAYVIYTSGSTGRPKGVMNGHRGVINRLLWMQDAYALNQHHTVLQKTPFGFDVSVWEFFWPLLNGARLVMARAEGHKDPAYLVDVIQQQRITTLHFVPSMLQVFLEQAEVAKCSSLTQVVSSGEALPGSLARRFRERLSPVDLHNLYGPTEAAVDVTAWTCADDTHQGTMPIGRPIANTRIYLLDRHLQPVPVGVTGEIYIGGVQVARGYLNRPELTAERYVGCLFGGEAGERMYRTGDLGRYLADGTIEYLGRNDFQVKVRGFRIELEEVESRLAEHPAVREAVVVAREENPGEKRLVAYYTTVPGATIDAEGLRAHLSAALPESMVPAAYVRMEGLPLTANGKLDRRALPAPDGRAYAARGYEAPKGEIEIALARIWAEILKLERVGRYDHFFQLGGHSLLALRLIERMRREGLHADLRAIFGTPTLAALAAVVSGESEIVEVPTNRIPPGCEAITPEMLPLVELSAAELERIVSTVPGGAANVRDIYPLGPLQEGILFHHLMENEGDVYLMSALLSFDSRGRLDGFLQALQAVIERHDILRTAVLWEGLEEPVQVVWRRAPLCVEEVSLNPGVGEAAEELLSRFNPRHYRLDIRQAPLLRVYFANDARERRWVMLFLFHHLSMDHTTLEVLLEEMQAHLSGRVKRLPEPQPFRNYVARARQGVSRQEHEAFFRGMLGDVAEPTAPYGLIDVQGGGLEIREAWREVDAGLAGRLRQSARALGVSAASVFHLAWAQVLARVTGRDDVVFGTVLFGRMQGGEGVDRVPGMFINTLPIRIRISGESVEEGVRKTHGLLAQLLRHEHAPLVLAQRCSAVVAPAPLFTALLNYRHSPTVVHAPTDETFQTWEGIEMLSGGERTNYPFSLDVNDLGEGFTLAAQVQAPIDPVRICTYMHTALVRLVEALENARMTPLRSLDILPASERRQLLLEWNDTEAAYPHEHCLHELFEAQAALDPDAIAVVHEDNHLSYGELNSQANRLAHHLRKLGVKPDDRIVVCVERSPDMVVGLLAALKAGGAYVPLDPAYPHERLAYILEDSDPVVVLTQVRVKAHFHMAKAVPVIDLEADASRWGNEPDTNPDRAAAGLMPTHLAYVIYTSGSTGQPKGVMVEHRSLCNQIVALQKRCGLRAEDRLLQFASINFDVSAEEIFCALGSGAALILRTARWITGAGDFGALCRTHQISWADLPTRFWEQLIEDDLAVVPTCLRRMIVGGEAVNGTSMTAWFSRDGYRPALFNAYGPTEMTVNATIDEPGPDDLSWKSIGRAMANTRIYLLDGEGQPVPSGVSGEIYISGAGIARGYLNRPELTAERFVASPFVDEPGGRASNQMYMRMYRTGDLARYLPDGKIEFLGRSDFQIKLRGFRIELGEIEARLVQHPAVREAVVLASEDSPGDKRLVAYYTRAMEQGASSTLMTEATDAAAPGSGAEVLRSYLSEVLPEYMVPAAYVELEALPLTPNGKLNRKALPLPRQERDSQAAYAAPTSAIEEILIGIFKEVLKLNRVGTSHNFFEIGGHSLSAIQVVSRVRSTFGVEIGVRSIFEEATVGGLVRRIEEAMKAGERVKLPPLVRVERNGQNSLRLPLSFAQQRLWFLDQLAPNNPFYNIPGAVRLKGRLDLEVLERVINEIVRRHEVLRTRFEVVAGGPVQTIDRWEPRRLEVDDLTSVPREAREAVAKRIAQEEAEMRFDLSRGPLLRVKVLELGGQEHILLYTMHHIVSDGWSMGVLVREVGALYEAYRAGEPSPLEELEIQYADFAVWQKAWLKGEILEKQMSYWREQLAGVPITTIPADRPRTPAAALHGNQLSIMLPEELSGSLEELSRKTGVTLFMTLLAAFQALLRYYTRQDDIVIGTDVANRDRVKTEGLIGFFVNLLVMRTDLSNDPTFEELLGRVREVALNAYAHQDMPFDRLVEVLSPERNPDHTPLFQVKIVLQNTPAHKFELSGLTLEPFDSGHRTLKNDLILNMVETNQGLSATLMYNADLYEASTAEEILKNFGIILRVVAAQPHTRLSELDERLAEAERQWQLLRQEEFKTARRKMRKSPKR